MDDREDIDLYESQEASLVPAVNVTRRLFAAGGGIGAGFAMLVQPVSAATLTTDTKGLTAGMVEVDGDGRKIPAYRAYPAGRTNRPVVLVIHEIFGLHEHIKDLCRRLAHQGYYAICPDLYVRYGDATAITNVQELMGGIVAKVQDPIMKADLDGAVKFAASERAAASKLGVTGFCWGGRQTWKYTAMNPAVKAGVAWYGPLAGAPAPSPTELAGQIKGRVLGLYGEKDAGIPLQTVTAMRAALTAAGDDKSRIVVYRNAPHGFNADYRPSYVEADAKDGWAKMTDWFKAHGVA